jgi:hypothetical protein
MSNGHANDSHFLKRLIGGLLAPFRGFFSRRRPNLPLDWMNRPSAMRPKPAQPPEHPLKPKSALADPNSPDESILLVEDVVEETRILIARRDFRRARQLVDDLPEFVEELAQIKRTLLRQIDDAEVSKRPKRHV